MNKIKILAAVVFSWQVITGIAQGTVITGKVLDAKTKLPLVNAGVRLQHHSLGTYSDHKGKFGLMLPDNLEDDTLVVSYVGYKAFKTKLTRAGVADSVFILEEVPTVLDEITILAKSSDKFDIKKLESSLRIIRGNLYATNMEVKNKDYTKFLTHLLRSGQEALYKKYKPDISRFEGSMLAFFKAYHTQLEDTQTENPKEKSKHEYDDYPIVNITHEAALAYCVWLTEQYNSSKGKRKFKQATFRLPKLDEWQIAALGYPRFQSWKLDENEVPVGVSDNPEDMIPKQKKMIPFKGNDIRYPWFGAFEYRNKPQNSKNCWMGNFKVPEDVVSCYAYRPDGDGYAITGKCGSYFPNDMGFYDVVGNVAEMIDEKGKACGGSWNHLPEESTIVSILNYSRSSGAVGFRVFMEVGE